MNKYFYLWFLSIILIVFPIYAQEPNKLRSIIEIERDRLEISINSEIALILEMAESSIIKRYLSNPNDIITEELAMEEIEAYKRNSQSQSVFWVSDIDKIFYFDNRYNYYTIDLNNPIDYWYIMTLYETDVYNYNINYNPELNVMNLWINIPVFNSYRQPIGIIGTGIDLSYYINNIYINYLGDAEIYLFNSFGEITGARDSNHIINRINIMRILGDIKENFLSITGNLSKYEIFFLNTSNANVAIGRILTLDWYIIAIKENK